MKKVFKKQKPGFTLLELMISIFIFSVVVVVVSSIFARGMTAYQYANSMQKGLEEAQFAMGQIAKVLRTSSVISSSSNTISVFDASQTKCVRYSISAGVILQQLAVAASDPLNRCGGVSYSSAVPMTLLDNGTITGQFSAISSDRSLNRVGKVSMVFVITAPNNSSSVRIQSSVSLRDYKTSGML